MPTQTRGFFSCDFCGLACDTLDEAKEHEIDHCPKRPAARQTPDTSRGEAPRYPPGAPPPNFRTMPPHPMDFPPSMPPPMHPPSAKLTRSITLLGPHERTPMSMEDSVACQNIELFEATPEDVEDGQEESNVVARQVGIRCIHCAKLPPTASRSKVFPDSLGNIAETVRTVADNHLSACQRVPPEVREVCDRAANKRAREQGGEGRIGEDEGNDRDEMALIGYCVEFCHRLGVVNKQPHKSGIAFLDGGDLAHYPYPATTPLAAGRGPPGPYSAERMGPPMSLERGHFRTPGPPGSHPRGGPFSMMGGPTGPEGIAATPLQSRRDRDGGHDRPAGFPGDREAGPTPSGGYPGSFPGAGPDSYGRPDVPGMQTPAQANYEGQGGTFPPSAQRNDGTPPGYQEMPAYDLPANFPFYQESNGTWCCKFCSHVHPQYRDPQSVWSSSSGGPPPGPFIDEHLNMCRAYYQSTMPPSQMYPGSAGPYGAPMLTPQHMSLYGPPGGPWEAHNPNFQYPGQAPYPYSAHPDGRYPGQEDPYRDQRRPAGTLGVSGGAPSSAPTRGATQPLPRKENSAEAIGLCINHLLMKESEYYARDPNNAKIARLVLDEDRLLLTDYFFYLMKQLRLCRFSESDRKTRGGKREKIKLGYGGLQCIHCCEVPNSRKFFWSNVDRLANSFAEIPGHVLKCRRCPQQTKDALLQLKSYHPEQMARLPRGSQKVFFRRMWRRLHDEDPDSAAIAPAPSNEENISPEKADSDSSTDKTTPATQGLEDSPVSSPTSQEGIVWRTTKEAAEALADSRKHPGPLPPSARVLLAIPEDKEWLSDMDCFIRKQLEVFCANEDDIAAALSDRKYPVHPGQVGIRCIHCATAKPTAPLGQAVSYPFAINGIYESVREFQRLHLDSCENVPAEIKRKLSDFQGSSSLSSVLRKYYMLSAKGLGLQDTREGIQAGAESVPINPHSAFSYTESPSRPLDDSHVQSAAVKDESSALPESPAADDKKESKPAEEASRSGDDQSEASSNGTESEKKRDSPSSTDSGPPTKMAKTDSVAENDTKSDE
eukprot:scaffold2553_cov138-Cylindrotheca_fusiformis.AAC.14